MDADRGSFTLRGVVLQEGPPCHRGFLATAVEVYPDRRRGYRVAQEREDLLDDGRSPERIVARHLADESPEHRIDSRSA